MWGKTDENIAKNRPFPLSRKTIGFNVSGGQAYPPPGYFLYT
jgi:hypothetical protein